MTNRIGVIGAGVMGEALIAALIRSGTTASEISFAEKRDERADAAMRTIEDMRKRAPEKSDFEIQQDLIESMVDKMTAARSGVQELDRLKALKAYLPGFGGGRGTSGFSITPLPEKKFDLGLGSLGQ